MIANATAQRWEHAEVLRVLLAEEVAGREQATIRMRRRASGLPAGKTFDVWEPDRSAIPTKTQRALQTLEWIDRAEALRDLWSERDRQEPSRRSARPPRDRQRQDRRLAHARDARAATAPPPRRRLQSTKRSAKLIRADLVVIDDVGLLPVSADAAEALFRVIDAAYEKRSIAISSNIHPSGFDELMPKSIATATVDRLLHHAHVLITEGQDSYRLAQATAGKGVKPLT